MKLKILGDFIANYIVPWIGLAADFISKRFTLVGKAVIFLPIAIIFGIISLFKNEIHKAKHPPR